MTETSLKKRGMALKKLRLELRMDLAMRQDGVCYWCGKKMGLVVTLDHIKPRSLGGQDTLKNCVAACEACNKEKSNHTASEFIRRKLLEIQAFMNSEGFKKYVRGRK